MFPYLLLNYFHASEWQTLISTMSVSITLVLSVVWNQLYCRMSSRGYLTLLWASAIAPLAGIALCHHAWSALAFIVIAATGFGGMQPLSGDILRNCYPPVARNRVFSAVQMVTQFIMMVATYAIGLLLSLWPDSFRLYLPVGTLLVGAGMWLLCRITRRQLFIERQQARPSEPLVTSLARVYHNMLKVFREDSIFRRHETAFSIYGLGWMICWALLPFLGKAKLGSNYEQFARSTQMALYLTMLLAMLPAVYLMDRLGPLKAVAWSFAALSLYPVGLIWADDVNSLTLVTVLYGIMLTGVNLAWTLGPIFLARDAAQAPTYLAIHATMVGIRGVVGQTAAVAWYHWMRDLYTPLLVAMLLFAGGAVLMFRVERDRRAGLAVLEEAVPVVPPSA